MFISCVIKNSKQTIIYFYSENRNLCDSGYKAAYISTCGFGA